jgi:CheY-like chemotaxis protein
VGSQLLGRSEIHFAEVCVVAKWAELYTHMNECWHLAATRATVAARPANDTGRECRSMPSGRAQELQSTTALAVEDPLVKTAAEEAAKELGLGLTCARTPEEAVRCAADPEVAVVVLDLNSSRFRPLALIKKIKADTPATRIVGFVAQNNTAMRTRAHDAGCDFVYTRPELIKQLKSVLRALAIERT